MSRTAVCLFGVGCSMFVGVLFVVGCSMVVGVLIEQSGMEQVDYCTAPCYSAIECAAAASAASKSLGLPGSFELLEFDGGTLRSIYCISVSTAAIPQTLNLLESMRRFAPSALHGIVVYAFSPSAISAMLAYNSAASAVGGPCVYIFDATSTLGPAAQMAAEESAATKFLNAVFLEIAWQRVVITANVVRAGYTVLSERGGHLLRVGGCRLVWVSTRSSICSDRYRRGLVSGLTF